MSWAILHIPSGEIYIGEYWYEMDKLTRTHMEYFIHSLCFNNMVPVNEQARQFRVWCKDKQIKAMSENEFEILENYEVKDVTG